MDMMDKLSKEIHNEDFIIRVRPFASDDGKWSGEVDISIMAMPDNPMDDEDYNTLLSPGRNEMTVVVVPYPYRKGNGSSQVEVEIDVASSIDASDTFSPINTL